MPKSKPSSKNNQPLTKKRKKSARYPPPHELMNVCTVSGLEGGITGVGASNVNTGLEGDNLMDCLEELASAQIQTFDKPSSSSEKNDENATSDSSQGISSYNKTINTQPSTPPAPPGINKIPNLQIELSRHLQISTLSTFLLKSCSGLRMPSFERWLLDSKLEERDRFRLVLQNWAENPSLKLASSSEKRKKGKHRRGRFDNDIEEGDARKERERDRKEKEVKLLLDAEKCIPGSRSNSDNSDHISNWISHIEVDPVVPWRPLETDSSCIRLLQEIAAFMISSNPNTSEEVSHYERANEIVRELCDRASEAWKDILNMEQCLGKYQKFGWDTKEGSSKKRKKGKPQITTGADKIHVEWNNDDSDAERAVDDVAKGTEIKEHDDIKKSICTIIYVPKKRKSSHGVNNSAEDSQHLDGTHNKQPKPFVIKINASHYHKLRAMFDETYKLATSTSLPNNQTTTFSMTKTQATHAFQAVLFATVIRYSSLSGGQQLNDWRGGGMQGAIHEGVFDCFSKWFGRPVELREGGYDVNSACYGTECFASPFNSTLSRYFSAFPSPDIDGHFGSNGDFFSNSNLLLRSGWFEANPPFSPGIMTKMTQHIEEVMGQACKQHLDVTFIIVIPTCHSSTPSHQNVNMGKKRRKKHGDSKRSKHSVENEESDDNDEHTKRGSSIVHQSALTSFNQLISSHHCVSHTILPAREHGYIEGSQHLRPTKFKEAQYSTSVIILRSTKSGTNGDSSRKQWDVEVFEKELREAFASRHAMEVEKRKMATMATVK